ncbi:MAG: hypothetical protein J5806_06735 [Lentisphaeria bacterium]|nr:hypothetical protein [Lentisphaeria bacterium]
MKIQCPYCNAEIELPESPVSRHLTPCPVCCKKFLALGELSFRYGISLPKNGPSGPDRVECPYCGQHYNVNFTPLNGMIGCVKCLKVFAVPPDSSKSTVDLSASDMVSEGRLSALNPRDTSSVRPYPPPSSPQDPVRNDAPPAPPAAEAPVANIAPEPVQPPEPPAPPAPVPAASMERKPVENTIRPDAVTVADVKFSPPVPPHHVRVLPPESLGTDHPVPPPEVPRPVIGEQPVPAEPPIRRARLVRRDDPQKN